MARQQTHAETFDLLVTARQMIDRMTLEHVRLTLKIGQLEQEAEALREMVSTIAAGGKRAAL